MVVKKKSTIFVTELIKIVTLKITIMKTTLKTFETCGGRNLYAVALAVKSQTGLNKEDFFVELENVLQSPYGAAAGFGGFIYYSDTVNFWRKNRSKILRFAEDQAKELDVNIIDMVAGFNAIKGDFTAGEIAFYYDIFKNS